MLTIRHISPNHDSVVTSAIAASHHQVRPDGVIGECVNLQCGPEDSRWIWDGVVYCMNNEGKTVATFHLSPLDERPKGTAIPARRVI